VSTPDNASVLSSALQANWQLSSPAAKDILWASTRVDAATFLGSCKNYAVCCYNPASPTQVTPLSREVWQQVERVIIDVYVKVTASPADATVVRESMKQAVYAILHVQELKIQGIVDVYVERETGKNEGPDLVRITLQVACVNFHVVS
jgi:hypothetical protein